MLLPSAVSPESDGPAPSIAPTHPPTARSRCRNRCFNWTADEGECNWAGPSWPYETSRVLSGLANLLNDYMYNVSTTETEGGGERESGAEGGDADRRRLGGMSSQHYMQLLKQYAVSMTQSHPANSSLPYIGENIEPDQGFWQARAVEYGAEPGSHGYKEPQADRDRSVDYNHSTFIDLILEGLVGLRAALGSLFTVNPLGAGLAYWAADNIPYHNHSLSIAWDAAGTRHYPGCKQGLCVWLDGKVVATSPTLTKLELTLPHD